MEEKILEFVSQIMEAISNLHNNLEDEELKQKIRKIANFPEAK